MDSAHKGASIELKRNPAAADRARILAPLLEYNEKIAGPYRHQDIAVLVSNEDGDIAGGLWGRTGWNHLFVELFYLPDWLRGQGLGRVVLAAAEEEALSRGCQFSWLDTYDFQAPGFYTKLGYQQFGEMPDHPEGHRRIFFRKSLHAQARY